MKHTLGGLAAATVVTLALSGAVTPAQAAVPDPTCPPVGGMPPIGNVLTYTDASPAVFVGGDYLATGSAAESEGLLVVLGNATFDKAGVFNVGSVGVGSGIVPPPGEPMLQVGGDLTVVPGLNLDVGANVDGGGDVLVGGATSGNVITNGGTASDGLGADAAIAPHGTFLADITSASADLAGQTPTGTTTVQFGAATFAGAGATDLEVFTVDAAQLAASSEVHFTGVADDAPIVVNVVGGPIAYTQNYVSLNGTRVDAFGPDFGNAASQILWNFVDTPSLTLGGSSQFMGSILAPAADVSATASTNGRVLVGGDFTTSGVGNEQHNYPWIGGKGLDCTPTVQSLGGFSGAKVVDGEAAGAVPAETLFTLGYSYLDAGGETVTGTLSLPADGSVVAGPQSLPVGTVVTFTEVNLPTVDGVEWGTPVVSPSSVTIADGQNAQVSVTNTADEAAPSVGGFAGAKVLAGEAAEGVAPETTFALDYSYLDAAGETVTGTLSLPADGSVVAGPQSLPVGTVVTFTEVNLPTVDGVEWGTPVVSPDSVTIAEGETTQVTVTNTANESAPEVGGFAGAKALDGDGADAVPAGTVFTLDYSYPDADGATVTGSLTLPADGSAVAGPQSLPVGTVVTFAEADLPAVDGVEWGTPVVSPDSVTIAEGETAQVTVTNTATAVPEPTPTPTPTQEPTPTPTPTGEPDPTETPTDDPEPTATPTDDPGTDLPDTGAGPRAALVVAALVLLAGGGAALVTTRTRPRRP
ncbi:choice-of-anchor A family protein [Jiangella alba]|uniref:Choice-of-anchor A domain-containing protein n=1 Tax=Jiangella alba TaxID=561176 RepID=A0A1H5J1N1_9ACTN|nr:choice-of-anchor A family protein [Jiangella alba]SEE46425.1 choice-of-anchor A domain-containing protein [Jiangella alba]